MYNYVDKYAIPEEKIINIENSLRQKLNFPSTVKIPAITTGILINTIYDYNTSNLTYIKDHPVLQTFHYPDRIYYHGGSAEPLGANIFEINTQARPYDINNYYTNGNFGLYQSYSGPFCSSVKLITDLSIITNSKTVYNYYEVNEWGTPLLKGYFLGSNLFIYNTSPNPIEVYDYHTYNYLIPMAERPLYNYTGPIYS